MKLFNVLSNGIELPSGPDFVNKLFPNIWAFLVQLFAFIIMIIIVIKFAYKPVKNFIAKRKEFVQTNLDEAKDKNNQAEMHMEEAKANLADSKKKAVAIIQDAQKEAGKQREQLLEETNLEISKKRLQAQEDIKKEQQKAIKEVHDDVVDLAYEATKSILGRQINQEDDKKMVDDFVNDLIEKR